MLKLLATTAMKLKKVIETISSISNNTHIEFSENFTGFYSNHRTTNGLAMLHLSSNFFGYYDISRPFIIRANLPPIIDFLGDQASDDDTVCIYSDDEFTITSLEFFILTSADTKNFMTLEVKELHNDPVKYEPIHEFKVEINSNLFRDIAMHSAQYETPISISVTNTVCLTLASGSETKQDVAKFKVENAPKSMMYELRLPSSLARSIIWASSISEVVYLRDSYSSVDPPVLEFIFDQYSRLTFYMLNPLLVS